MNRCLKRIASDYQAFCRMGFVEVLWQLQKCGLALAVFFAVFLWFTPDRSKLPLLSESLLIGCLFAAHAGLAILLVQYAVWGFKDVQSLDFRDPRIGTPAHTVNYLRDSVKFLKQFLGTAVGSLAVAAIPIALIVVVHSMSSIVCRTVAGEELESFADMWSSIAPASRAEYWVFEIIFVAAFAGFSYLLRRQAMKDALCAVPVRKE